MLNRLLEKMFLDDTREGMWNLPDSEGDEKLLATSNAYHISTDAQLAAKMHRPLMRYRKTKAIDCSMAQHKNNHNHPTVLHEAKKNAEKLSLKYNGIWGDQIEDMDESAEDSDEDVAEKEGNRFYYTLNFSNCKVGSMCVGVAAYEEKGEGLFVGRVKSRDEKTECFTTQEYKCRKDMWSEQCVNAKWWYDAKAPCTTTENFSVISYFRKLNSDFKIPKVVQKQISARNIKWGQISK